MTSTKHIHIIGIAGSAMSPLAGMLKESGYQITGSDSGVYPPASTMLEKLGVRWMEGFREENLTPVPDLVVVGNAAGVRLFHDSAHVPYAWVPVGDHQEVWAVNSRRFKRWLRFELEALQVLPPHKAPVHA